MRNCFKTKINSVQWIVLLLALLCVQACKEENVASGSDPHDPSKPVQITDFSPKTGGVGQRLVIYGNNFGNDTSIVRVAIGGRDAKVIGVNNESLYVIVPEKAYDGDIVVRIGSTSNPKEVTATEIFTYQRKMVVTTLAGYEDERGNYETKDGPFWDCGGFSNPSWLEFDPKNPHLLYMAQDGGDIRLLNFRDSMVTTPITRGMGNWGRIRTIDFTLDGDHMIISNDQWDQNHIATSILSRANNFRDPQVLTTYRACNGASIHPVNGEMYFNSFEKGQFFRFDMNKYFSEGLGLKDYVELFKIQDNDWEFNIRIHPSGNYAYIIVINRHYILRTDYNWDRKEFMQPYVICGEPFAYGWVDGVGTGARLRDPYQGVFVKNPEYEGRADEYDFYFTEQHNHDIRILTPEGKVTTFAGRGSSSINPDPWGYIDGDLRMEARFDQPKGLAYDEVNNVFYVGDAENRRVRKISFEE